MVISEASPVWTTSTGDVGPVFNASRTFGAGDRVSLSVSCRDTGVGDPTVVFNGVDSFTKVEDRGAGTNVARLFVYEGVVSAGATANVVVTFPDALAAGSVIIGTSVITGMAAGAGWRDAASEDSLTTTGALSLTITSETDDVVIAWAVQRGTASALTADGSVTEVGTQGSTGLGGTHLVAALWRIAGASPNVAIGGTWNSSNGGCLIGHNVNAIVVVPRLAGLAGGLHDFLGGLQQ